jgi:hypothetical protein
VRTDQYVLHLSIDGVDVGIWDQMTGGDITSASLKYRAGGQNRQQEPLGGPRQVSDITVTRKYDLTRDHQLMGFFDSKVGRGNCVLSKQPLDEDDNVFGRPIVYQGKFETVNPPDVNSDSPAVGLIAITISAASLVGT